MASLLGRYALAIDTRDYDALRGCFAADAVFISGRRESQSSPLRGIDEIVRAFRGMLAPFAASTHLCGPPAITIAKDHATACSFGVAYLLFAAYDDPPYVITRGLRYDDQLEMREDLWVIQRRVHQVLWASAAPAVDHGLPPASVMLHGPTPAVDGRRL